MRCFHGVSLLSVFLMSLSHLRILSSSRFVLGLKPAFHFTAQTTYSLQNVCNFGLTSPKLNDVFLTHTLPATRQKMESQSLFVSYKMC